MSRTTLVSGNWKMHLNHLEAIQLVQRLSYELAGHDYNLTEVSLHPPFTDIRSIQTLIDADRMHFKVGAQNVHPEDKGAFTGEVSPPMLAKLNVSYVIVGHSERRQLFGETDEIVNTKAKAVVKHQMTPIVCCGETLEEREAGDAESVVEAQVRGSLAGLSADQLGSMVVAYEPIWAIGTGVVASTEAPSALAEGDLVPHLLIALELPGRHQVFLTIARPLAVGFHPLDPGQGPAAVGQPGRVALWLPAQL